MQFHSSRIVACGVVLSLLLAHIASMDAVHTGGNQTLRLDTCLRTCLRQEMVCELGGCGELDVAAARVPECALPCAKRWLLCQSCCNEDPFVEVCSNIEGTVDSYDGYLASTRFSILRLHSRGLRRRRLLDPESAEKKADVLLHNQFLHLLQLSKRPSSSDEH